MKIVVCMRQGLDGEPSPFDACAYEAALEIEGAEVILLSMGPPAAEDFLRRLTRLGASRAVLLSDPAFAGADTLATAKTLAAAIRDVAPDLVFCGRQTLVGDTAQTGPMLARLLGYETITNVMQIEQLDANHVTCRTRSEGTRSAKLPALLTLERINTLRLPRLRSRVGEVECRNAASLGIDRSQCGLAGSPTRVVKTFENQTGKRRCEWITRDRLPEILRAALEQEDRQTVVKSTDARRLPLVATVGDAPMEFAKSVSDRVHVLPITDTETLIREIQALSPSAVLWGSDARSKRLAAEVAAAMDLGLCADCTRLETDGKELLMYRPALSGSTIAKIRSLTRPAMATVRTTDREDARVIVAAGYGVKDKLEQVKAFAESIGASFAVSRRMVDNGYAPYDLQVGLTGKTVAPPLYIAVGISGAVHHIVGMQRARTVIAINPDRDAPIFDYADFGILEEF